MHIHSCVQLGSVAFDLFLWGEKDGICVFGRGGGGNMAHKEHSKFATGNQFIWEGSQAKNREAPNNRVRINCPDFVRRQEDSRETKFVLLSCFHMCVMEILVWSCCHVILFLAFFSLLAAVKTEQNLNHSQPRYDDLPLVNSTASCLIWQDMMIYHKFSTVNRQ